MKVIKFHFIDGGTILSKMLKYWTEGDFSHVSVDVGGIVYEANGHNPIKNGVVIADSPLTHHKDVNPASLKTLTLPVPESQHNAIINFLMNTVGQGYDYMGAANFVNRGIMGKPNKWYCSELASVVFYLAIGEPLDGKKLISPQRLYDQIYYYKKGHRL